MMVAHLAEMMTSLFSPTHDSTNALHFLLSMMQGEFTRVSDKETLGCKFAVSEAISKMNVIEDLEEQGEI